MAQPNEDEFEILLKNLPSNLVAAFALRIALSSLHCLSIDGKSFLGYIRPDIRSEYLLKLFITIVKTYVFLNDNKVGTYFLDEIAYILKKIHYKGSFQDYSVYYSVYSAAYAAIYPKDAVKAAAAGACSSCISNSSSKYSIFIEIQLLKAASCGNYYLYQMLPVAQYHRENIDNFIQSLRDFGDGFEWWASWYQDRLNGVPLDFDFLESIIHNSYIWYDNVSSFNAYLKSLTSGRATRPLNQVRALFIGDGNAGKTSLIRALEGEEVIEAQGAMTPGIAIRTWPVPKTNITAHLWDFGGQVMAHAMHKFFLRERCIYVLVLDSGKLFSPRHKWLGLIEKISGCF